MLVANFMRFRRKRLEKQTHIDNFSLKKNSKRIYLVLLYLYTLYTLYIETLTNFQNLTIVKTKHFFYLKFDFFYLKFEKLLNILSIQIISKK